MRTVAAVFTAQSIVESTKQLFAELEAPSAPPPARSASFFANEGGSRITRSNGRVPTRHSSFR